MALPNPATALVLLLEGRASVQKSSQNGSSAQPLSLGTYVKRSDLGLHSEGKKHQNASQMESES